MDMGTVGTWQKTDKIWVCFYSGKRDFGLFRFTSASETERGRHYTMHMQVASQEQRHLWYTCWIYG